MFLGQFMFHGQPARVLSGNSSPISNHTPSDFMSFLGLFYFSIADFCVFLKNCLACSAQKSVSVSLVRILYKFAIFMTPTAHRHTFKDPGMYTQTQTQTHTHRQAHPSARLKCKYLMRGSLWIILDVCFDWLTFCVCLVLSIFLGFDFTLKLDQLKYRLANQSYYTY